MSNTKKSPSKAEDQSPSETVHIEENENSIPIRLFGQFKNEEDDKKSPSKNDEQTESRSYFTSTISKLSNFSSSTFGSASISLATSLASLDSSRPLFGGLSVTPASSFTDLKATATTKIFNNDSDESDEEEKTTLSETVAEYEAKRASVHPTTTHIEGDTSTGEENEVTKFQIAGKLFMYNSEKQQFLERGFGILKINETDDPSIPWDKVPARLIMRLDKSFRVILNSPIFSEMTVERVTDRSIRFGAQDEGQLRVFIIKASSIDCSRLYEELRTRIDLLVNQQSKEKQNSSIDKTPNLSSTDSSPANNRKRSHSQTDSDTSPTTNDLSKKSKLVENPVEKKHDLPLEQTTNTSKEIVQ